VRCPEFSRIPPDYTEGAQGPESCLCAENYSQKVNVSTGEFLCIKTDAAMMGLRNYTEVPTVTSRIVLEKVTPLRAYEQADQLRRNFASTLGLQPKEYDRVSVDIVSFTDNPGGRRLGVGIQFLQHEDNQLLGTEQEKSPWVIQMERLLQSSYDWDEKIFKDSIRDLPPMYVTIELNVWQSTFKRAFDIKDNQLNPFEKGNDTLKGVKNSLSSSWTSLSKIYFNFSSGPATTLAYQRIDCLPFTAIRPGTIFESANISCECIPGYEPVKDAVALGRTNFLTDEELQQKCAPCKSGVSSGMYKPYLGDVVCTECDKTRYRSTWNGPEFGRSAATQEAQCTCKEGEFRSGDLCFPCPPGTYCEGKNERIICPPNTMTLPGVGVIVEGTEPPEFVLPAAVQLEQCQCEKGYFRAGDTDTCEMCDEGYYKEEIKDGSGRCEKRCADKLGFRSTSPKAAIGAEECFCAEDAFLKNISGSKAQCSACPIKGVVCRGGFEIENITGSNETRKVHRQPYAIEGYYMIDKLTATVTKCRADGGKVCLEGNVCIEGHEDFICGTCEMAYTRDQFQKPCRPCEELPKTVPMFFMMFLDLTTQTFWNGILTLSAISKTEANRRHFDCSPPDVYALVLAGHRAGEF